MAENILLTSSLCPVKSFSELPEKVRRSIQVALNPLDPGEKGIKPAGKLIIL
ncbi:MAG: hypothetical protein JXA46_12575 [Dehalococcoidales bacterium]|nr:hypothetical protein [Dehalococcoidales bacterium]